MTVASWWFFSIIVFNFKNGWMISFVQKWGNLVANKFTFSFRAPLLVWNWVAHFFQYWQVANFPKENMGDMQNACELFNVAVCLDCGFPTDHLILLCRCQMSLVAPREKVTLYFWMRLWIDQITEFFSRIRIVAVTPILLLLDGPVYDHLRFAACCSIPGRW